MVGPRYGLWVCDTLIYHVFSWLSICLELSEIQIALNLEPETTTGTGTGEIENVLVLVLVLVLVIPISISCKSGISIGLLERPSFSAWTSSKVPGIGSER